MKRVFLICGIFSFLFVSAQRTLIIPQKSLLKKIPSYQPWINKPKNDFKQDWNNILKNLAKPLPQAKLLYTLKNNTRVFSLPQDNMICLVPDMKQFNMPNLVSPYSSSIIPEELKNQLQHQPGRIPNPTIPLIIPQRKDTPTQ